MLNKWIKQGIVGKALLCLMVALPNMGFAANLCANKGYTVGFFNQSWSTPAQAASNLAAMRTMVGTTKNAEPVRYEVFFNHGQQGSDAASLVDIAAFFRTKALTIDASGDLGRRMELFWEGMNAYKPMSDKVIAAAPSASALLSQLFDNISAKVTANWSSLPATPSSATMFALHKARLDALAAQNQKVMLVGYSQGGQFVNSAYDHMASKVTADSVKAFYIAPQTNTIARGRYVLSSADQAMIDLVAAGVASVPLSNLQLLASQADPSGHDLVESYLGNSAARDAISGFLNNAMSEMQDPSTAGGYGAFFATLTWEGTSDMNLSAKEPVNNVYYTRQPGDVGIIDGNVTTGYGPETYMAPCDSNAIQEGTYFFSGAPSQLLPSDTNVTLQITTATGQVLLRKTKSGKLPIIVGNVVVTKDPVTGALLYDVNSFN